MMHQRIYRIAAFVAGIAFSMNVALAAGGDSYSASDNPEYVNAVKAIKLGRYKDAIPMLNEVVAAEKDNADAYNLLGFSYRKSGNYGEALTNYQRALELEPKHRGANEYLGELYLETGDLAAAEAQLKVLDKACLLSCKEYRQLKKAIKKYKGSS